MMETHGRPPAPKPWLLLGLGLGLALVLLAALGSFAAVMILHPEIWRDFRGEEDPDAPQPVLGGVCWESPQPLPPPVNTVPDNVAAGFTGDGDSLVFARRSPESGDFDLYVTILRAGRWSEPEPLLETNTDADELGPSLSRNSRYLFFHSNRAGGYGGHDLYVAIRGEKGWGRAFNLGPVVNSEFDEMDPHLTPDETDLYFASNRPKADAPEAERRALWEETTAAGKAGDIDIFVTRDIPLPDRDDPLRDPDFRRRLITQLGGSVETEGAVLAALDWLTRTQEPEGYWDTAKLRGDDAPGGSRDGKEKKRPQVSDYDAAATAIAALCYYGWGERHDREGPYRKPLLMAMDWLTREARRRKGQFAKGSHGMYLQAIVTLTLAEALAATKDEALLREPAGLCADVIVKAQDPVLGGWRYRPVPEKGDTSVLGWQVTALRRARAAGIAIPDEVFTGTEKWLGHVSSGEHGGMYGYQDRGARQVLTAVGMFVRQLLGARPAEDRQQESSRRIVADLPSDETPTDLYFWYYGFLALYQQQGSCWEQWNRIVRAQLLARQEREGDNAGSWEDARWKGRMDRVVATALATLSLEVYYRYLPMYDFEGMTLEALKKSTSTMRVRKIVPPGTLVPLAARRLPGLSSTAADRAPAFTRDGTIFYFSSERPGGRGGFDLYGALVREEGLSPVENLGDRINSSRDDFGPTLSDSGYRMVFSSDRAWQGRQDRLLYDARSFDASLVNHWENFLGLLSRLQWWLMGAAVGLLALAALLVWYFRVGRRTQAGLKARCYFTSAVVHAAILFLFSVWMIRQAMQRQLGRERYEKIVIGEDTLATERLALELRESVNKLDEEPAPLRIESPTPLEDLPEIVPIRHGNVPTLATEAFVIERPRVDVETRPVTSSDVSVTLAPKAEAPRLRRVKITVETELESRKETPLPAESPQKAEVNPVLKSPEFVARPWAERPGGEPELAPTTISESPVPDAAGPPPPPSPARTDVGPTSAARLYGTGEVLSRRLPNVQPGADIVLEAPSVAPSIYVFRDTSKRSLELVRQLGGSDLTEQAVNDALDWFTRHQEPEGHWSCKEHGGEGGHDTSATGAAMLCFFGWGAKHNEEGPHQGAIARAMNWLLSRVAEDGNLTGRKPANMYDQGIGTMALSEAYGLTRDPRLKEPLQRAVDCIVKAQHPDHGGWRYTPGSAQGDTSVGGWQVMALVSAKMAGADVPEESLRLAGKWLDSVSSGPAAGLYSYTGEGRKPDACMTSVGMFCQQLFQVPPHDPRQEASAHLISRSMPDPQRRDYYYWYYGTIALYQHQGPIWEAWNEKMKQLFIASQVQGGEHAGSWPPDGRWTRGRGGRVISTAFSTLSLEVYYRYLPLYNTSLGAPAKQRVPER